MKRGYVGLCMKCMYVWPLILINCSKTSEVEHRFLCDFPYTFVNLHKGGRQREEDGKPCVTKRDNNSVWKQFSPNFTFLFVKDQNTVVLIEHQHKHAGNRPVTFVTHKRFAVLFFAPSCCVSLLKSVLYGRKSNCVRSWKLPDSGNPP